MPILPHAKKALRSSEKKAQYNQRVRSRVKTMMDKMRQEPTQENLASAYQAIDKAAERNIYHHNKAARLKAQMARLIK